MNNVRTDETAQLTNPKINKSACSVWTFWVWVLMIIGSLVFVSLYSPAKQFLITLGQEIEGWGWGGNIVMVLVLGLIIIPLALPYFLVETTLAIIIPGFWLPFSIAVASKTIGCSLCYLGGKTYLRKFLQDALNGNRIYKGVNIMLQTNPWKFSFIFRLSLLPYFVKNYGLAVPQCITFSTFIVSAMTTGALVSGINIHVVQNVRDVATDPDSPSGTNPVTVTLTVLSVLFVIYLGVYTYRIVKQLERDDMDLRKTLELSIDQVVA